MDGADVEREQWLTWLVRGHYGFDWWHSEHPPVRAAEYAERYYLAHGDLERESAQDYIESLGASCGWRDEEKGS